MPIAIENPMMVRIESVKYVTIAIRPYSSNSADSRCLSGGLPAGRTSDLHQRSSVLVI